MGISGRWNIKSLKQEARNALQLEHEDRVEGKREAAGPGGANHTKLSRPQEGIGLWTMGNGRLMQQGSNWYGLNCAPQKCYIIVLISSTSECDLIWR